MEESKRIFGQFLDLCRAVTENDTEIIKLLQQRYDNTNQHFLWSPKFNELVDQCSASIIEQPSHKYVHIQKLVEELKLYKGKPLKHLLRSSGHPPQPQSPNDEPLQKRVRMDEEAFGRSVPKSKSSSCRLIPLSDLSSPKSLATTGESAVAHTSSGLSGKHCKNLVDNYQSISSAVCGKLVQSKDECTVIEVTDDTDSESTPDSFPQRLSAAPSVAKVKDSCSDIEPHLSDCEFGASNGACSSLKTCESKMSSSPTAKGSSTSSLSTVIESSPRRANSKVVSFSELNVLDSVNKSRNDEGLKVAIAKQPEGTDEPTTSANAGKEAELSSDEQQANTSHSKHIAKLERLLKKINDKIHKLEEKELSLDDLDREDSTYMLESLYKNRAIAVWNKLCELKGTSTATGRAKDKPVFFQGTKYKEVNKHISRYINKFKEFPDYHDVLQIVVRCNQKFHYKLTKSSVESVSRDAFLAVGNILQSRRHQDFVANFGCHLTDSNSSKLDPATSDFVLKQKLDSNRKTAQSRMEQIINKYAEKQDRDGDKTESESDDDDDDGDNEEESESPGGVDIGLPDADIEPSGAEDGDPINGRKVAEEQQDNCSGEGSGVAGSDGGVGSVDNNTSSSPLPSTSRAADETPIADDASALSVAGTDGCPVQNVGDSNDADSSKCEQLEQDEPVAEVERENEVKRDEDWSGNVAVIDSDGSDSDVVCTDAVVPNAAAAAAAADLDHVKRSVIEAWTSRAKETLKPVVNRVMQAFKDEKALVSISPPRPVRKEASGASSSESTSDPEPRVVGRILSIGSPTTTQQRSPKSTVLSAGPSRCQSDPLPPNGVQYPAQRATLSRPSSVSQPPPPLKPRTTVNRPPQTFVTAVNGPAPTASHSSSTSTAPVPIPSTSARGKDVRRPTRVTRPPRSTARQPKLRPEDLYAIGSQIAASVMRQSSDVGTAAAATAAAAVDDDDDDVICTDDYPSSAPLRGNVASAVVGSQLRYEQLRSTMNEEVICVDSAEDLVDDNGDWDAGPALLPSRTMITHAKAICRTGEMGSRVVKAPVTNNIYNLASSKSAVSSAMSSRNGNHTMPAVPSTNRNVKVTHDDADSVVILLD